MAKHIIQKIFFKNTSAKILYELYMNSKKHSAATGAAANISAKEGGKFSAYDGYIHGKNLQLVKDQLILQTWRGEGWNKKYTDSIFSIFLQQKGKNVLLHAVHANVPDKEYKGIDKGWHDYYWKPWKKYLAGKLLRAPVKM